MCEYVLQVDGIPWVVNCLLFVIEMKASIALHRYAYFCALNTVDICAVLLH